MPDPEHLKILKQGAEVWNKWREDKGIVCPKLRKVNLSKEYLEGVNLVGAILEGSDLSKTNLYHANLSGADLNGVNLSAANLRSASLKKAKINRANLENADLSRANLEGAELSLANLSKAKLYEASFDDAAIWMSRFTYADLTLAQFSRANLTNCTFRGADLTGAILRNAKLLGANLSFANLRVANLTTANLREADLHGTILINANLTNADISGVRGLNEANLSRCIIKDIICTHIMLNDKRIDYSEGEFEKKFTQVEKVIDITLNVPFSDFTYYTGKIIENLINEKYGEASILFKGLVAISDNAVKQEFVSFADQVRTDELQGQMTDVQNQVNLLLEKRSTKLERKSIIDVKEEIDVLKALVVRPKEIQHILNEYYMTMSPILQKIIQVILKTLR